MKYRTKQHLVLLIQSFDRITVTIVELWNSVPGARLTAEAASERMKLYRLETFDEMTTDSSLGIEVSK